MMDEGLYIAIVAEYRNIAIIEKRGDKIAFFNGQPYWTDGFCYVLSRENDTVSLFRWNNEKEIKDFIDNCFLRSGDLQIKELMNKLLDYQSAWELIHKQPFVGDVPLYVFDEEMGIFVQTNGIRDGQHRHWSQ